MGLTIPEAHRFLELVHALDVVDVYSINGMAVVTYRPTELSRTPGDAFPKAMSELCPLP